ncbi:MAG: alkaline phosphatase [Desulfobacterales bacterium]|nr:alkaline phosphatase [Desulfobacterales bacterium]
MYNKWKKNVKVLIAALSITLFATSVVWALDGLKMREKLRHLGIKNVIIMVPDGCDETVQTVARWFKGENLQLDKMQGGGVKTHMADSIITDSAAAATAFACGHKTSDGFVGVGPSLEGLLSGYEPTADPYTPIASVLEAAKIKGMATGIVVTCRISHATPAGFASHVSSRAWDNDITEQMVYNNIDVVFGGGARHLIPEDSYYTTTFGDVWKGKRTDGDDLIQILRDRGYAFVDNTEDMQAQSGGKVWGLFDDSHMEPDIDRQYFAKHQPSLAEMTAKAIELLSQDRDGFFLHVEGSQVDWAGHANDPIYMVTDFLAFDEAVKIACDFADRDGHTLVLAFPDHNTGGMKIGHYYTPMGYTKTKIEDLVDPLKGMKITSAGLVKMMEGDDSAANIQLKISKFWSLDITEEQAQEILNYQAAAGVSLDYAISYIISKYYTVIGWTTHGHNGETVPLWSYGAEVSKGIIDDTQLATIAADAMNTDLDRISHRLYVGISTITNDYEIVGDLSINDYGLTGNLVLKVRGAEFPINKDYMTYKNRKIKLPGLTIYAPVTGEVYVSQKAVSLLGLMQ